MTLRRPGLTPLPALPLQAPGQVLLILHTVQGRGAGRRDRVRHGLREYRAGPRPGASRRGCGAVRGQARAVRCGTPRRPPGPDVPGTGRGAQSGTLLTPRDPPREPAAGPPSPSTPPPPSPASAPAGAARGSQQGGAQTLEGTARSGAPEAGAACLPVWGGPGAPRLRCLVVGGTRGARSGPLSAVPPRSAVRCAPELPPGRETH